jgi:GAF domain-containing protein
MSEQARLRDGLAALSQFFVGGKSMTDTLTRVSEMTVEAVPAIDFVGITMMVDGKPATGVFTDSASPEIDQAQYDTGEGPCLDAFRQGEMKQVESTDEDGPWPAFRAACLDHGIHSTLSLPMVVDGTSVGAMNLYATRQRAFGGHDVEVSRLFAVQAAVVLANAQAYWDARLLSEQLGEALENRGEIDQAKGIIMSTTRCSAEEAFQLLVRQSQRQNIKVRDLAHEIVLRATHRP